VPSFTLVRKCIARGGKKVGRGKKERRRKKKGRRRRRNVIWNAPTRFPSLRLVFRGRTSCGGGEVDFETKKKKKGGGKRGEESMGRSDIHRGSILFPSNSKHYEEEKVDLVTERGKKEERGKRGKEGAQNGAYVFFVSASRCS